jgi:hypothetical protein
MVCFRNEVRKGDESLTETTEERAAALSDFLNQVTIEALKDFLTHAPECSVKQGGMRVEVEAPPSLDYRDRALEMANVGINVQALQRLEINPIGETFFMHKAATPGEKHVVFTGLEGGIISDVRVPFSLLVTDEELKIAAPPEIIKSERYRSLFDAFNPRAKDWKKSNLGKLFRSLSETAVYRFGPATSHWSVGSYRHLMVIPAREKSIIVVSCCPTDNKWYNLKVQAEKEIETIRAIPPGRRELRAVPSLIMEADRIIRESVGEPEGPVEIPSPPGRLPIYLLLEAIRRQEMSESQPLSMEEVYGKSDSERVKEIAQQALDDSTKNIILPYLGELATKRMAEGEESGGETSGGGAVGMVSLTCPECGASGNYSPSQIHLFGAVKCTNCGHRFSP